MDPRWCVASNAGRSPMRLAFPVSLFAASCAATGHVGSGSRGTDAPPPEPVSTVPSAASLDAAAEAPEAKPAVASFSYIPQVRFLAGDLLAVHGNADRNAGMDRTWTILEAETGKPIREIDFEPLAALSGGAVL